MGIEIPDNEALRFDWAWDSDRQTHVYALVIGSNDIVMATRDDEDTTAFEARVVARLRAVLA